LNHRGAVVWDDKLYAFGGREYELEGCGNSDSVTRYDPETDSWAILPPMPLDRSHVSYSTFVTSAGILMVGGIHNNPIHTSRPGQRYGCRPSISYDDALLYEPKLQTWTPVVGTNATSQEALSCALFDTNPRASSNKSLKHLWCLDGHHFHTRQIVWPTRIAD
jgi:hypothetical protein